MRTLFVLFASLLVGCSSYDLTTPSQESLTGKWNLVSVNGNSLPYGAPQVGSNKQEVVEDVLTLTAPNTFTEVNTLQNTQNGHVSTSTITDSGTYDFNSYVVNFHFQSNGSIGSATLTGRTMEVLTSGVKFSYKKQ